MKLLNKSTFLVCGLNKDRLINELSKICKISNIQIIEYNKFQFEIQRKYKEKIKLFLLENNYDIISIKDFGFSSCMQNLFKRKGIVFGIIFVIALYLFQYPLILRIEVNGNSYETDKQIKSYLSDNLRNKIKFSIKTAQIEQNLMKKFNFISSVSVIIKGQSLIVNYNLSNIPQEMNGNYTPLYSQYDGIIKSINLIQGTINCKVGDIVKVGDILVYPFIIDSQGEKKDILPKANIVANVWNQTEMTFYENRIEKKKTGNKIVHNQVMLNSMVVFDNNPNILYKNYEVENFEIKLIDNNIFPFILKKKIYYEVKMFEVQEKFESVKEKIIEQARQKTLIFLDKNAIILKENYLIQKLVGCYKIKYIITSEQDIGGVNAS